MDGCYIQTVLSKRAKIHSWSFSPKCFLSKQLSGVLITFIDFKPRLETPLP